MRTEIVNVSTHDAPPRGDESAAGYYTRLLQSFITLLHHFSVLLHETWFSLRRHAGNFLEFYHISVEGLDSVAHNTKTN
jgi:hypothetical protein